MSVLSSTQQELMEKPVVRIAHFIELHFSSGTSRIGTFNTTIPWGGYDWSGLGQILSIGQVSEGEGSVARSLTFSITAAKAEWLALAVGPVDEYRGGAVKLYVAPLGENFQLTETPKIAWTGNMDAVTIAINGDDGGIEIRCETAAYGLKRRPVSRMNPAQHKQKYPNETGFDYLPDLLGNPKVWLSKKFQRV